MTKIALKKECLPEKTRIVFEWLAAEPLLKAYTLIGGTALALQIGHRLSEDLDFWIPNETLVKHEIATLINHAQEHGFSARLAMSNNQLITAKINGIDILLYSQDYEINKVKVTFFARKDLPYQYFDQFNRINQKDITFAIMQVEGLLAMKSYVIHHRTRSRDIFDLFSLLKQGWSIDNILHYGKKADPITSVEYAKAVLLGLIPLDVEDEGLATIGQNTPLKVVYDFFKLKVDEYEIAMANQIKIELGNVNSKS